MGFLSKHFVQRALLYAISFSFDVSARIGPSHGKGRELTFMRNILEIDVTDAVQAHPELTYESTSQDHGGNHLEELDDGATVRIAGNMWKAVPLPKPVDITLSTVLEFEFTLEEEAEGHYICLDNDLDFSNTSPHVRCFRIAGTQNDPNQPQLAGIAVGATKHYKVPVGLYFTGFVQYLAFIQDQDADATKGISYFKNIKIHEAELPSFSVSLPSTDRLGPQDITFNTIDQVKYGGTQDKGNNFLSIDENGSVVTTGNVWKAFPFPEDDPLVVTHETMLDVDLEVSDEAEMHSICLDEDTILGGAWRCFQLGGTQSCDACFKMGATYENEGKQHFSIPVGLYFTGNMKYIAFFQDYDAALTEGHATFSDISIYSEVRPELGINLNGVHTLLPHPQLTYQGHKNQDRGNNLLEVSPDSKSITATGNTFKAFALPAAITATTDMVLDFKFHLEENAEWHGICLEEVLDGSTHCIYLAGTQAGGTGVVPKKTTTSEPDREFRIPVGQIYTGTINYLAFELDYDANLKGGNATYSDISIFENPALDIDVRGTTMSLTGQTAYEKNQDSLFNFLDVVQPGMVTLAGNIWKALPFTEPITITEDTILAFDYEIEDEAEMHSICLDEEKSDLNNPTRCFHLGGTQEIDKNDFHTIGIKKTQEGQHRSYLFRIGRYFTGTVNYLALLQDNDANRFAGSSTFANFKIFDVPVSCLKGSTTFSFTDDECTLETFLAGVQTQLTSLECSNTPMVELMALFNVDHDHDVVEKIGTICSSAYGAVNLPFDQVTLDEYQFNEEYFDGGTTWNYGTETADGNYVLAEDAGRVKIMSQLAGTRGISYPEKVHNFKDCDLRAVTCCWVADRQGNDSGGTCDAVGCNDADPEDNSDLCYVDFTRSQRSGHVRDGYSIYGDGEEGPLYCRGFAWGNDVGYADSALKGNTLFHVAMLDGLYGHGYVEEVPGAPMCGCVEQMPVATRADCTELSVAQEVVVKFESALDLFTATVSIDSISYADCEADGGNNDLSAYYDELVKDGKATADEKAHLDKILVGVGNCDTAVSDFLGTKGFAYSQTG